MERKCLKCNHSANMPGLATDECPQCGAIYAKVEQHIRSLQDGTAPAVAKTQSQRRAQTSNRLSYVEDLRSETLYPTSRWWVNLVHTIITVVCVVGCIGGLILLKKSIAAGLVTLGVLLVFWLASRVAKEMCQMIIDLCDASVRTAYAQEKNSSKVLP